MAGGEDDLSEYENALNVDADLFNRSRRAIEEALRPIADGLRGDDVRGWRTLAYALSQMAEGTHPGPWRSYLADVCGLEPRAVPDEWRERFGPCVALHWHRAQRE